MGKVLKKAVSGSKKITLLEVARYATELLIITVTARILSPSDFGIVGLALVVIGITDSFSELGIKTAIIQFKDDSYHLLNTAWTLQLIRAFLLFLLLYLLAEHISVYFDNKELVSVIQLLALRPILQALINPVQSYHIRKLNYRKHATITSAAILSRIIVVIPATLLLMNYWALVIGGLSATFIKVIVSYIIDDYRPRFRFELDQVKRIINFGIWLLFSRIILILTKNLPSLVIGKISGLELLGGVKIADQIGNLLSNVFKKYSSLVLIPVMSEKNRVAGGLADAVGKTLRILLVMVIPISLGGAVVAEEVLVIFLGQKWDFAAPFLSIMFLVGGLQTIATAQVAILVATGKPELELKSRVVAFVVLAVGMVVASDALQVIVAVLISSIILVLYSFYYVVRQCALNVIKEISRFATDLLPVFTILIVSAYMAKMDLIPIYNLSAVVGCSLILYFGVALITHRLFSSGPLAVYEDIKKII